jgi:hypothetical protein
MDKVKKPSNSEHWVGIIIAENKKGQIGINY